MKIKSIKTVTIHQIKTDEPDCNNYTRYGEDSWMVQMGCSDEEVYDCEKLEKAFQQYWIESNSLYNPIFKDCTAIECQGSGHCVQCCADCDALRSDGYDDGPCDRHKSDENSPLQTQGTVVK